MGGPRLDCGNAVLPLVWTVDILWTGHNNGPMKQCEKYQIIPAAGISVFLHCLSLPTLLDQKYVDTCSSNISLQNHGD